MSSRDPEWLGTTLTGFRLVERIADGRFSEVYRGENFSGARKESRLFKIAKRETDVVLFSDDFLETNAFEVTGDGVSRYVRPNTNQLIGHQHALMTGRLRSEFVRASNISELDGCWFYTMEDFGTENFRSIFDDGRVTVDTFYFLISVLIRLREKRGYQYHGDLKPEHLIWTSDQIKLCDLGFFGQIDCYEGDLLEVAVTSRAYYPLLQPDDMLAVGLMFWEAVMGFHPLVADGVGKRAQAKESSEKHGIQNGAFDTQNEPMTLTKFETKNIDFKRVKDAGDQTGTSVREWLDSLRQADKVPMDPLSRIMRPTSIIDMPPLLEDTLLKGLRLEVGVEGSIEKGNGYSTWEEWLEDTVALSRLPVNERQSMKFLYSGS